MPHVRSDRPSRPPAARRSRVRRAVAAGTWSAPRDGATHGFATLDVTGAEEWCRGLAGVTLTHVLGCAVALGLRAAPDLNSRVVLGRVRPRESIDVAYVVDVGRGADMTAVCVRGAEAKGPRRTAREVLAGAREIRRGRDRDFGRAARVAGRVPAPLVRPGMAVAGFVTGGLGRAFPPLGLRAHPFGSALVSAIGPWDLERAIPPVAPFARLGLVLVLGTVGWRPWVVEGEVRPRRAVDVGMTIDHRLADGAQIGTFAAVVRAAVERPWEAWPTDAAAPPAA